jgi:hypothetical protein
MIKSTLNSVLKKDRQLAYVRPLLPQTQMLTAQGLVMKEEKRSPPRRTLPPLPLMYHVHCLYVPLFSLLGWILLVMPLT